MSTIKTGVGVARSVESTKANNVTTIDHMKLRNARNASSQVAGGAKAGAKPKRRAGEAGGGGGGVRPHMARWR